MRQGPEYSQHALEYPTESKPMIGVPLELVEELSDKDRIVWVDNGDGTYTLKPEK